MRLNSPGTFTNFKKILKTYRYSLRKLWISQFRQHSHLHGKLNCLALDDIVNSLYVGILDRQAESTGFTSCLTNLQHGMPLSKIVRGMIASDEFQNRLPPSLENSVVLGLTKYFVFYNGERPHQALDYKTPNMVYMTATGGGALIVDKFGGAGKEPPVPLRSTADSLPAEATSTATEKPGQRRAAVFEAGNAS